MIPKVYIQCHDGIPATRNLYDCYIGFKSRGHQIIMFDSLDGSTPETNINLKELEKQDIVCAGIPVIKKILGYLKISYSPIETYPESMRGFLDRKVTLTTLGHIRNQVTDNKIGTVFIKPNQQKLFTGFIVNSRMDMLRVCHINDNIPIWVSEPVSLLAEFRVYVNQENPLATEGIVGCCPYNGNALVFPNPDRILEMVKYFNTNNAPVAYGIDIAVKAKQSKVKQNTILVEVNDGICLGSYGLPSPLYCDMIEARWNQIIKNGSP